MIEQLFIHLFIIVIASVYGLDSIIQWSEECRVGGCSHLASYNYNTAVAHRGPLQGVIGITPLPPTDPMSPHPDPTSSDDFVDLL